MHQQWREHHLPSMRNFGQGVHLSDAVACWGGRKWCQKGILPGCRKRESTGASRGTACHSYDHSADKHCVG